jgi:outer membrane receptor protein involved in Fe transport
VLLSKVRQAALATNSSTCLDTSNSCVPINLFGPDGSITAAQAAFVTGSSTITTRTTLAQVHGQINGDLGINSPFATSPIGFAVGAEYRRYTAQQRADALAKSGDLGGFGSAPPDITGAYSVYEGFAETDVPLIEDRPLFKSLDLQAGIRRSQYKIEATGSPTYGTTTYKAGLNWEPVPSLKLRGNYQHAVRAPNINELFSPLQTVLTNYSADPCAGAAPVGNANLTAICRAQGAPAASIGTIETPSAGQANLTTGGNPSLQPETSNSFTLGAVFQPSFVPRLTATVDYYNIKVANAITTPTPDDLVGACFNNQTAASATSAACTVIRRDPVTGQLSGDTLTVGGLYGTLSNLGRLATDGIDVTVNYTYPLSFGKLNFAFNGNWTRSSVFQATPSSSARDCVGYYSVNCASIQPKFSWNLRTTMTVAAIDISLLWRHIDSVQQEPGSGAFSGDPAGIPGSTQYNFGKIPAYNYIDLATRFNVTQNIDLTVTVTNLFDKQPPIVGYDIGATSYNSGNTYPSTYDPLGRRFSVAAHLKF